MYLCHGCNETKDRTEFGDHKTKGRQFRCKECRRLYQQKWYLKNKALHIERASKCNKLKASELRQFKLDYLSNHPCVDCGETNPIVLEFDHVRGDKIFTIGNVPSRHCSLENLIKEIEKCDIRCANCHRIVTYNRRKN